MFAIVKGHGRGGICDVRYPGVQLKYVCSLLSYVSLHLLYISSVCCWWAFIYGFCGEEKTKEIRAGAV